MQIKVSISQDIKNAKQIWKSFVKPNHIGDDWGYREIFFDNKTEEILFIYATVGDKLVFLAPFVYTLKHKRIEFFGKNCLKNSFYCIAGYEYILLEVLKYIKNKNTSLNDILISSDQEDAFKKLGCFKKMDTLFYIDIGLHESFEEIVGEKMSKRSKLRILKSMKLFNSNCTTSFSKDSEKILELSQLNIQLFGKNSAFHNQKIVESILKIENSQSLEYIFLDVCKGNSLVARAFLTFFNGTIYAEYIGYTPSFPNTLLYTLSQVFSFGKKNGFQKICLGAGGEFLWKKKYGDFQKDMYTIIS